MFSLNKLYSDSRIESDNPLCSGCSILTKPKPCHSVMDYEELKPSRTLFLSDSIKYKNGSTSAFSKQELDLIRSAFPEEFAVAASVKCPSVKEADMSPANMNICRQHLEATIDKVKPELIFVCGNLPMKMLIKKSGITTKRGKSFDYTSESGHTAKVVPIYHPYSCIREPRHIHLFEQDIKNAYGKYILGRKSEGTFQYKVLMDVEDVEELWVQLKDTQVTIAVDVETTGLNFLRDYIMTVAISAPDMTYVIPVDHKDSPFKNDGTDVGGLLHGTIIACLKGILENPKNRKVMHNAKFDAKFFINYGIYPKNIWDTKLLHHVYDENVPKSLMDLVKLYFSEELEDL